MLEGGKSFAIKLADCVILYKGLFIVVLGWLLGGTYGKLSIGNYRIFHPQSSANAFYVHK